MTEADVLQLATTGIAGRVRTQATAAISTGESPPAMGTRAAVDRITGAKKSQQLLDERAQQRVEDAEFIREAQKGSRAAFDTLVRRYDQPVLRLALHIFRSVADALEAPH